MKVVYVAGPFRAPTFWGIVQNIHRAEEVALRIWCLGAAALTPHLNTANFQGAASDGLWIEGTLELLRRCDAIFLLPNWRTSSGTIGERQEANARGMPVFEDLLDLAAWLRP